MDAQPESNGSARMTKNRRGAAVRVAVVIAGALVMTAMVAMMATVQHSSNDAVEGRLSRRLTDSGEKDIDKLKIGYGARYYPERDQVVRLEKGREVTQAELDKLAEKWGKWSLKDTKDRPKEEVFTAEYPNRDIPFEKIPDNAWQKDKDYMEKWLKEGLDLVERAQEAILAEYGMSPEAKPGLDFDTRADTIFGLDMVNMSTYRPPRKEIPQNAGFTDTKSFDGLVRRLLHALVTQDTFTVVLGGHSAAAGHGNLFRQSYTMQYHKVMEPLFALLGVKAISRNLGHGGLGTLESSMGAKDIYGDEIDIMLWDSGMTEGRDMRATDLFARQSLIAGNRVPFLFGGIIHVLKKMSDQVDADVGQFGDCHIGQMHCESAEQVKDVPFAARCLHCDEKAEWCGSRFRANCWVPRDDVEPLTPQLEHPGSQVSWHPGNLWHQAVGRGIAFTVLRALKKALLQWQAAPGYVLDDKDWHVHDYYEHIREKVRSATEGPCFEYAEKGDLPGRFCTMPINARTEFEPRNKPDQTGLHTIVHPNENGVIPSQREPMLYTGPNVYNELLDVPEGEIDVLMIISNGREVPDPPENVLAVHERHRRNMMEIKPGIGTWMEDTVFNGYCDGTWNTECNRAASSNCLILSHGDCRGGIDFGSYSGWIVMTLPNISEGIIVTKMETWHYPSANDVTKTWDSINNRNEDENVARALKPKPPEFCDDFRFQFAIDGKVTEWNKEEFLQHNKPVQRVVETQTLLDDPNFTDKPRDVTLAIRMLGCGPTTGKLFGLTHVYFA